MDTPRDWTFWMAFACSLCACMGPFCVLRLPPNPTVQTLGEIMILQGMNMNFVSSMFCSGVKKKNPVGRIFQISTINKQLLNTKTTLSSYVQDFIFLRCLLKSLSQAQQGYYYKQLLLVIALCKHLQLFVNSLYFPRKMTNRCSSLLKQSLPNSNKVESQYMA